MPAFCQAEQGIMHSLFHVHWVWLRHFRAFSSRLYLHRELSTKSSIASFRELLSGIFYAFLLFFFYMANKITKGFSHGLTQSLMPVSPRIACLLLSRLLLWKSHNYSCYHGIPYTLSFKCSRPIEPSLSVRIQIHDFSVSYSTFLKLMICKQKR